ncbi:MAG: gliding motility protein GldN [Tannerella sp.]|jgi:gliding motility associated protien GldN|nr:gliding motility protein GldN [Tannerella sp.]
MKRFLYTSFILLVFSAAVGAQNPEQRTPRISRGGDRQNRGRQTENNRGLPELTVRAQIMNEQLAQDIGNARWMRVIYREIDLVKEKNTPLYYPLQEISGMKNLFTTMFQLVSDGKIDVYKYLPDYESFEADNLLSFKDMLDNFNIFYEEMPAGGGNPVRYVINASDIPSQEVRAYIVKEAWYFDQNNSVYDVNTLAICPIAFMISDIGEQRTPMFWVKYEDLRPYIKNNYIMTSNMNNAKTFTVDDYFRRRMFDGEIVKTENLMNLALLQYCPTPDSMLAEQQRIENQLKAFNDSLWIQPDTTVALSRKEAKKAARATRASAKKNSGVTSDDNKSAAKKEKAPKQQKEEKPAASKSAPARSIRRR